MNPGRRRDRPPSTAITRRNVARLMSCPARTVVPSARVISILPSVAAAMARDATGERCWCASTGDCWSLTRTGRNTGAGSTRSVPRRTWRRQFHKRLRQTSSRRATSTKRAPGRSVSATIRSLPSIRQRRRRSIPVMISIQVPAPALNSAHKYALKVRQPDQADKAVSTGWIHSVQTLDGISLILVQCSQDRADIAKP
jgi:hypothetical protein